MQAVEEEQGATNGAGHLQNNTWTGPHLHWNAPAQGMSSLQ